MNAGRSAAARSQNAGGVTETRRAAALIMRQLRNGEPLDALLDKHATALDARDRRWLQELVFGTLRNRSRLDALIEGRVTGGLARLHPGILDLLRIGTYQLLFMASVPAYAAIAQSVELGKQYGPGAAKLVNAVLRRLDRERSMLDIPVPNDPVEALALNHSHPAWIVRRWVEAFGIEGTRALLESNNRSAPVCLRHWSVSSADLVDSLNRSGVPFERSHLLPESLVLGGGVALTELAAFQRGHFFVQDPAATLVSMYADIVPGSIVADVCAAPGGKSLELARQAGVVLAGDGSERRLATMLANIERLHAEQIHTFVADARHPPLPEVDAVLLDAPCTGTGTYRRHPDARWRMKASDIAVMSALQRSLLESAARIVKCGGLLIYATCSIEPEENEHVVRGFLAAHTGFRLEPPRQHTVPHSVLDGGMLRVLPHVHGADGSFAARLRRVE